MQYFFTAPSIYPQNIGVRQDGEQTRQWKHDLTNSTVHALIKHLKVTQMVKKLCLWKPTLYRHVKKAGQ
jgi:hypothetical protein